MRKYLSLILLIVVLVPLTVEGVVIKNPLTSDTFVDLMNQITNIIFYLAIVIAPIMFIVAGFYYLTAAGSVEKVSTAKKIILYTLIGLIIIISAKGMVELFQEIFVKQSP